MKFSAVALAAFAPIAVMADGASIIAALNNIKADSLALNATLNSFTDLITAIPILGASIKLQNTLDAGTATANASAQLTTDEAVALVGPTNELVAATKSVIANFISKKKTFDANGITVIASSQLGPTKEKANAFSEAVIAKVPAALQPTARQLTADLNPTFQSAIDAYSTPGLPSFGSPAPAPAPASAPAPAMGGFKLPFKA